MVEVVGTVGIDLKTNSSAFITDMKRSSRAVTSGGARMNKALVRIDRGFNKVLKTSRSMVRGMLSMRGVMAGVAGAAGIGLMVKKSIDFADAIGKTADKVGLTTSALQELRFAAEQSGVDVRTLDLAMQRFSRRVGEAAQGQGELKDTLKQYGIAVLDTRGKQRALEDVLDDYADAVKKAGNAQEQLRLNFKAFDSEGAALVNITRKGSAGLRSLRDQARRLGLVLDDKLIRNAERAKNELNILSEVIKIKAIAAVVSFAPEVTKLAQAFIDAIPKVIEFGRWLGRITGLFPDSTKKINETVREIEKLQAVFDRLSSRPVTNDALKRQLDGVQAQILAKERELRTLLKAKGGAAIPASATPAATPAAVGAIPLPSAAADKKAGALFPEGTAAGLAAATRANAAFATSETEKVLSVRDSTDAMMREAAQIRTLITATGQGTEAVRAAEEIFELQNAALAQGIDLTSEQGLAWEAAFRRAQMFTIGLEDAARAQDRVAESAREVADTFSNVVDSAIDGSIRNWRDLGRVAVGIIEDILKAQIRANAVAAASSRGGLFGQIAGAALSLFSGSSLAGAGPQFTGTGQVGLLSSGSFAHGGGFTVGGSGGTDKTPVAFNATRGEHVEISTPAQQRAAGRGQVVINQSFDFRGADVGVFARAGIFAERIKEETIAAVFQAINNGGPAAAMVGRSRNR